MKSLIMLISSRKCVKTPEWKKLMSDGAFNESFMIGDQYVKSVADAENCMKA